MLTMSRMKTGLQDIRSETQRTTYSWQRTLRRLCDRRMPGYFTYFTTRPTRRRPRSMTLKILSTLQTNTAVCPLSPRLPSRCSLHGPGGGTPSLKSVPSTRYSSQSKSGRRPCIMTPSFTSSAVSTTETYRTGRKCRGFPQLCVNMF